MIRIAAALVCITAFVPSFAYAERTYEEYENLASHPPHEFLTCSTDDDCVLREGPCVDQTAINKSHAEEWSKDASLGAAQMKCRPSPGLAINHAACIDGQCEVKPSVP